MDTTLSWWMLVTIGVALLIAELFIGAFIVMWFGLGAIAAGLMTVVAPGTNLGIQILVSTLIGAVLMYFLRDRCVTKGNARAETMYTFSSTTGEVRVSEDGTFSVSANGTLWRVANPEAIPDDCRVNGALVEIEGFQNNRAVISSASSR